MLEKKSTAPAKPSLKGKDNNISYERYSICLVYLICRYHLI